MAYLQKFFMPCFKTRHICGVQLHTTAVKKKDGSAGIIVIGDEILKGQVADTNSHFIAKHLFDLGIKVKRISVIGDQEKEIAKEVQKFSKIFSYVITTGGIGPTHDDVTFDAVATAFGLKLEPHPELVKLCTDFFHTEDLNSPAMKIAHVPESAKLTYGYDHIKGRRTLYPNVSVHNVYIFPGIPDLMKRLFLAVYKELFQEGCKKLYIENLYLNRSEVEIADNLNAVVKKYSNVTFGSYPIMFNRYYQVHVTIQSESEEETGNAYRDLIAALPKGCIVNFDSTPTCNAYQKIMNISKGERKQHIQDAMDTIGKICETWRPSEICVVFNGDPGSVVVTHLVHGYLRKKLKNTEFNGVNFMTKAYSTEAENFIVDSQARYSMKLERISGSLDASLKTFIESHQHFKAIFVGCASHMSSEMFYSLNKAEKSYPAVKWINPLTEWTSTDIWDFIYSLYLPYSTYFNSNK